MNAYYTDLHIHIGRTEKGNPVKISGSANLTFYNIAREASQRKGVDIVGIIDCQAPSVQEEIKRYLDSGEMKELAGGGIGFHQTTVILGSEIEVRDPGMGPAHVLVYMPDLAAMQDFTGWMKKHMKNIGLSSQRIHVPTHALQEEAVGRGGLFIPAHIFTPHRSVYGSCCERMADLFDMRQVHAAELGLSADSAMAGLFSELEPLTFLTNSDAHSIPKIAREYNRLELQEASFTELKMALLRQGGRGVTANYGLNPRLGKYHRTFCASCSSVLDEAEHAPDRCLYCGSRKIVRGVRDRISAIADRSDPAWPAYRPPYYYQIPLEFFPGLGTKMLDKLLVRFGTEMHILHHAKIEAIAEIAGGKIAGWIAQARAGQLQLETGGGGRYGKVSPF